MDKEELQGVYFVRQQVFVEEQGFPEESEFNDCDNDAMYAVAISDEGVIGTIMVNIIHQSQAKVERIAILKPLRRRGIGRALINYMEEELSQKNVKEIVLHAQCTVVNFYRNIGYEKIGGIFIEEGVPHIKMWKKI